MNKIRYIAQILSLTFLASSCVKSVNNFTDFSTTSPLLEVRTAVSTGASANTVNIAGLGNFGLSSLAGIPSLYPDTISFYVNLASNNTLSRDLHIKVGIDANARTLYNADAANTLKFDVLPDSTYSWTDKSVTIPAGQRVVMVSGLVFHYDKIDPTKNYMLPIGVIDGDGLLVSGNQGAIYFHTIGNPNAGPYSVVGTRTNYNGSASGGDVASVVNLANFSPKTASPESSTVIDLDYANLAPTKYIITFNAAGTAITDLTVDITGVTNFGVDLSTFDPATRTIHVKTHYTNGAGNDRVIEETFKHL